MRDISCEHLPQLSAPFLAVMAGLVGTGVVPTPIGGAVRASAADPKTPDKRAVTVIQFDAATKQFRQYGEPREKPKAADLSAEEATADKLRAVSTGRPIRIRIVNPNSFAESYKIEAMGVDFHRVDLGKFAAHFPGISDFLPAPRSLDTSSLVAQRDLNLLKEKYPELAAAHEKFVTARNSLAAAFPNASDFAAWKSCKTRIERRIATASTASSVDLAALTANTVVSNATIRAAVGTEFNALTGSTFSTTTVGTAPFGDLSDDAMARFHFAADTLRDSADKKINEIQELADKCVVAQASVKAEYDAISGDLAAAAKAGDPEATKLKEAAARLYEQDSGDKTNAEAAPAAITSITAVITGSIEPAITLVKSVMSKTVAPTYLEKQIEAQDDRIDIKVTVTTLSAEKDAGAAKADAPTAKKTGAADTAATPETTGTGKETSTALIDAPGDFSISTYPYSLLVSKRWVVDASGGLVVTFSRRETFASRSEVTGSGQTQSVVRRTGRSTADGDLGIFVHYYRTNPSGWAFGPALGLLPASTSAIKSYLPGFSLIRGQENRLILTVGAAITMVDTLSGVSVGDVIPTSTPPTHKSQKVFPFVSLSFQITRF